MKLFALLASTALLPLSMMAAAPVAGQAEQQESEAISRTEAMQINADERAVGTQGSASKAFLEPIPSRRPASRPSLMQGAGDQVPRAPDDDDTARQITSRAQSGSGMTQLSKADLDATLAQLSESERRVLLQAIEGTDICDNPPEIPAVIALCQNRLETRSQDFANNQERALSAEEWLLRDDRDNALLPSVGQVINRLARGNAATDDFNNQAIASIALADLAAPPPQTGQKEEAENTTLAEETQALVNAIINQLGGRGP